MTLEKARVRVLLVEDDQNDALFFQRAARAVCPAIELEVARDGELAVQMLSRRDGHPLPDRIVLDLKLPRRSGIEVLTWIRSNPSLKHLSVTILTSSGEPSDMERIRGLGIDEYIVKPVSYQGLLEIISRLGAKWGVASQ